MTGRVEKAHRDRADLQLIAIIEGDLGTALGLPVGGKPGAGELQGPLVSIDVIRMAVSVDDMSGRETLRPGTFDHRIRIVGRIDQDALRSVTVAYEIGEVTIPAGANLFEDKAHETVYRSWDRDMKEITYPGDSIQG